MIGYYPPYNLLKIIGTKGGAIMSNAQNSEPLPQEQAIPVIEIDD